MATAPTPIRKILVVDDSKTELMFLSDLLGKMATPSVPPRTRRLPLVSLTPKSPTSS